MVLPETAKIDLLSIHSCGITSQANLTLDVTGARLAHVKWIRNLQSAFRIRIGKPIETQPSEECNLGIWIHGTAMKKLGATKELIALDVAHKKFHRDVDIVLSSLSHRKFKTADETYEEALNLSAEIISMLTHLEFDFVESELFSVQHTKL